MFLMFFGLIGFSLTWYLITSGQYKEAGGKNGSEIEVQQIRSLLGSRGSVVIFKREKDVFQQSEVFRMDLDSLLETSMPVEAFRAEWWAPRYLDSSEAVLVHMIAGIGSDSLLAKWRSWPVILERAVIEDQLSSDQHLGRILISIHLDQIRQYCASKPKQN